MDVQRSIDEDAARREGDAVARSRLRYARARLEELRAINADRQRRADEVAAEAAKLQVGGWAHTNGLTRTGATWRERTHACVRARTHARVCAHTHIHTHHTLTQPHTTQFERTRIEGERSAAQQQLDKLSSTVSSVPTPVRGQPSADRLIDAGERLDILSGLQVSPNTAATVKRTPLTV